MADVSNLSVGIYARVSTMEQSCEIQLRDLRAYCTARCYTQTTEYIDTGFSGAKETRPALDHLMGDVRKRKLDGVVVWRFDRFFRIQILLLLRLDLVED
jgi:site-specific DNA recombinase